MPITHPMLTYEHLKAEYEKLPIEGAAEPYLSARGIDISSLPHGARLCCVSLGVDHELGPWFLDTGRTVAWFVEGEPNSVAILLNDDLVLLEPEQGSENRPQVIDLLGTISESGDDVIEHLAACYPLVSPKNGGFPYPSSTRQGTFVGTQGNDSTLIARRQARDISTRKENRSHGTGLLFEIEGGRITGVSRCENSEVLWVEGDLQLEYEGTSRRGLRLVEWYGDTNPTAHASRWAADIYVADPGTAEFVRTAILEKLANDQGIEHAIGEART